ncbi:MAG: cytochrome c [Pseudomonadota bacterium]
MAGPTFAEEQAEFPRVFHAGETAYKNLCAHCHGLEMVNSGVSSYDLRQWPKDDREGFEDSVRNGMGDMPAWADVLFPEEYVALWAYVVTRAGQEPLPEGLAEEFDAILNGG